MKKSRYLKRAAAVVLASLMSVSMAACGNTKEETVQTNAMPEFVYVPEYIELEGGEDVNLYNAVIVQDTLYYLTSEYNEEEMTSTTKLCRYQPLEGGEATEVPLELGENRSMNTFAVDRDGNVYFSVADYSVMQENPEAAAGERAVDTVKSFLVKYDAQGTLVYEQDITDIMKEDEENSYVNAMTADDSGRLYLSCQRVIRLFNSDGSYQGSIDMQDNWINGMGRGKDGKVYVTYYGNSAGGMTLTEIDFEGKKLGTSYENFPSGNGSGSLFTGGEKDFLVQDGTRLMEYDIASQTTSDVLTWLDSDINGQYVDNVGALSDGRILAALSDWGTGRMELALLTKTKSSELVQKEQITVGTLYTSQTLQAAAVSFNKSSDKYHVNIKEYIDQNNMTETSWSDAVSKLNNDITSGANSPDILDLSQLNTEQLAAKGVFEDLTPYLEKSTVLEKDDFMENILEGFMYNGRLVAVPRTFTINTVIGKSADVGTEMGWTIDELIAYAEGNAGANLFYNASKGSIMNYLLTYNMDAFVNWETGQCSFDTPEFKSLLTFVNTFPDEVDWEADTRSQPAQIAAGDVLLAEAYIYDLESIQQYVAMFGKEPVTFIGYPNLDGSVGCRLQPNEAYAVSSKSGNKEGAWAFVEHFLAESRSDMFFSHDLPTRQSEFDKMIEEATKEEYLTDENGNPVLDEEGNAIPANGMSSISYGDWEYTYHTPTKEEADLLRELVQIAKPAAGANEEINNIILEEAEAFYKGQKSVDDVAQVIQSRIQIYVSENS